MFPVFTSPLGSIKAILSLYWSTSVPRLFKTSTRDSALDAAKPPPSAGEGAGAPAPRGSVFDRTRSAQDLGAARGGEAGLAGSSKAPPDDAAAGSAGTSGPVSAAGDGFGVTDARLVSSLACDRDVPGTIGTIGTTGTAGLEGLA